MKSRQFVCLFVVKRNDVYFLSDLQLAGQSSSSSLQIKTDELSRQYREQLSLVRQEKDQEIQRLRVTITFPSAG